MFPPFFAGNWNIPFWPGYIPATEFRHSSEWGDNTMKMLFRQRITFDFRHWEITGDWLGWNCRIMDGSACVAVITKRLWKLTDTCGIDVVNPDDVPGTLMVVLAINAVKCSQRQ